MDMKDEDQAVAELERRIALMEQGDALGDCLGPSDRIYRELAFYGAIGAAIWFVLALVARP